MELPQLELLKNPVTWVVIAWMLRELWSSYKDRHKEHTIALKENTVQMMNLSLVLAELKVKIGVLEEAVDTIPKLREDLSELNGRVEQMAQHLTRSA